MTPSRAACAAIFLLSGWLLVASGAHAQEDEAEELITRGVALREQGRDEDALALFRQAHERSRSTRALAQVALAEQALGRWVGAHAHLTEALASDHAWIQRNRAPLERALETIRAHVSTLELAGVVEGAVLRINGAEVGRWPLTAPLVVESGSVVLTVSADGYHEFERTLRLERGLARERVELVPLTDGGADSITTESSPPAAAQHGDAIAPWVLLGGSAAVAVGGGVLLAIGRLDADAVENAALDSRWADYADAAERAPILMTSGWIALGLGVAGATASIAWALAAESEGAPELAMGPRGLQLRGSFQ